MNPNIPPRREFRIKIAFDEKSISLSLKCCGVVCPNPIKIIKLLCTQWFSVSLQHVCGHTHIEQQQSEKFIKIFFSRMKRNSKITLTRLFRFERHLGELLCKWSEIYLMPGASSPIEREHTWWMLTYAVAVCVRSRQLSPKRDETELMEFLGNFSLSAECFPTFLLLPRVKSSRMLH